MKVTIAIILRLKESYYLPTRETRVAAAFTRFSSDLHMFDKFFTMVRRRMSAEIEQNKNRATIGHRTAEISSCQAFSAKLKKKPQKIEDLPPSIFSPFPFKGCRLAPLRVPSGRIFDMQANLPSRKMTELRAQKRDFSHFYNFRAPEKFSETWRSRFTVRNFSRRSE